MISRRLFLCTAGSIAVFFPRPSEAQTPESKRPKTPSAETAGAVEDARGEAFAEVGKRRRVLERASPVFVRDQVGTGPNSRLLLQLGADTTVRLGERARLTIDQFLMKAGGEITLGAGAMLFERPAQGRPTRVQIRSSYGLIAVRGTRFFAGPSNNVFGVFVEEGTVTVSGGGRRVTLRPGEGTDIGNPGAPPTPPRRWGQARVSSAFASVR